jgi:hypothetical protein
MEEIELNGVKYVKAKGVKKELVISEKEYELPFEVGKAYFIRTVIYHVLGRVKKITGKFLEMEDASWIADSGRFSNAISEGKLDEIEPTGDAIVNTDSIIDAYEWKHKLPREQK